jgi:L-alanine-DL-glutamate epimerase-like enolase superfamily enzyme
MDAPARMRDMLAHYRERGAFDIVQPDVTGVGGLSEQRRP